MKGLDLTRGLEQLWAGFLALAPKVLLAVVILVVGYFVARLLCRMLASLLKRVGFDKLVERGGLKRMLNRTKYEASDWLAKLVYYALMLMVLELTFAVFGPNPVSALLTAIIAFLPQLFAALLIVVIASAIATAAKDLLQAALGGLSYGKLLANLTAAFIVATGIFAALSQLGIAPAIVNGLYYAMLAIVAGSAIIAIGGGGIAPMRAQWEKLLDRFEQEAKQQRQTAPPTVTDLGAPRAEVWPEGSAGNGPKKN